MDSLKKIRTKVLAQRSQHGTTARTSGLQRHLRRACPQCHLRVVREPRQMISFFSFVIVATGLFFPKPYKWHVALCRLFLPFTDNNGEWMCYFEANVIYLWCYYSPYKDCPFHLFSPPPKDFITLALIFQRLKQCPQGQLDLYTSGGLTKSDECICLG